MATLTSYASFDMSAFEFSVFRAGRFVNGDPFFFEFDPNSPFQPNVYVTGVNFTYLLGSPSAGTIREFDYVLDSATTLNIAGVSIDIGRFNNVAGSFETADDFRLVADQFSGNDVFRSEGAGDRTLMGFNGNDRFDAGIGGRDKFDGGRGVDTVDYGRSATNIEIDLGKLPGAQGGAARGDAFVSIERFVGTRFGDVMTGDKRNNEFDGRGGSDMLAGGEGNDTLIGGDGPGRLIGGVLVGGDTLVGGLGRDVLEGGRGPDTIVLELKGADVVRGFSAREDVIALAKIEFPELREVRGRLDIDMFHKGRQANDADDHIIYNKRTGNLFFDRDGDGTKFDRVLLAEFDDGTALSHAVIDLI